MRRREPAVERPNRESPPRWLQQILPALVEYRRRFGPWRKDYVIPEGFSQWRKAERDAWCRTNGCWRAGTKTCEQASPVGRGCGAREQVE